MEVDVTLPMPPGQCTQMSTHMGPPKPIFICMHRPYKNHGVPCRKLARKHGFCCSGHKAESQRPVQRLLAIMMRNESYWAWDDVLAYFAHARPDYVSNKVEACACAAAMLEHIIPKPELAATASKMGFRGTISPAAFIAQRCFAMAMITTSPFLKRKLVAIQRLVRTFLANARMRLYGPYNPEGPEGPDGCQKPMNEEDPFTLGPIADIPTHERFSYVCDQGKLYVLSLPDLIRYVYSNGSGGGDAINPYTREPLPTEAQHRLKRLEAMLPKETRHPIIVWRSPTDAFVDILHGYERLGFYTHVEWFATIHPYHVYYVYEVMNRDRRVPTDLFLMSHLDAAIEDDPVEGPRYALAAAMKRLIGEPCNMQFYTICTLFLVIAEHNAEMAQSLPRWILSARRRR